MKKAWERTAKIREALLAHRLRLEQAKAGVQVISSSIEYLASLILTFECSRAPDEQLKRAEQRLDELFEYLSDTRQAAEDLVYQVDSLLEDATLVHERIEEVMAAEPMEMSIEIRRAADQKSSVMSSNGNRPPKEDICESDVMALCNEGNFKRTVH